MRSTRVLTRASDAPVWNPNSARASIRDASAGRPMIDSGADARAIDIIDVSRPHAEQTSLQALVSFAGAAALSWTVPLMVLLIGLPIVLAIRGLLEAMTWFLRFILG